MWDDAPSRIKFSCHVARNGFIGPSQDVLRCTVSQEAFM